MKRILIRILLFFVLFCITGALWLYTQLSPTYRTKVFYKNGEQILSKVHEYSSDNNDYICIMLPSNEWYAFVLEHECCVGAGFSAVLIKDSFGNLYSGEENFCGHYDFVSSVHNSKPQNLSEFHEQLMKMGFRKGILD